MKNVSWGVVLAMGLATGAGAQECGPKGGPLVLVYLEDATNVPVVAMARAKGITAGMFAGIGVRVEWKEGEPPRRPQKPTGCAAQADEVLEVQFEETAATRFPRDAMAYAALGRVGICIHIFYNRVAAQPRDLAPVLLGHVLAHEITHVLEGVPRHSEDGVMKAHWTSADYRQMSGHPLPFAEEDIRLIRAHFSGHATVAAAGR